MTFHLDTMNFKNAIDNSKDGVLIKLHVIPGSSKLVFPARYDRWRDCIEIKVKAPAKENRANREIIEKIAEYFNISTKDVSIVSGKKGRKKTVLIKK